VLIRDLIIEEIEKEIIGPDPIEGHTQENGEEIINTKPTKRYGAGVLFPQKTTYSELEGSMADESNPANQDEEELTTKTKEDGDLTIGGDDDNDSNDEILNLVNSYLPSAIGFTSLLNKDYDDLELIVSCGKYIKGEGRNNYHRVPVSQKININSKELPTAKNTALKKNIIHNQEDIGLEVVIVFRGEKEGGKLTTFSLVNNLYNEKEFIDYDKCFFQVEMEVVAKDDRFPFMNIPYVITDHEDQDAMSNYLLYRNHYYFSTGHGCAVNWGEYKQLDDGRAVTKSLITCTVPVVETFPIKPKRKRFGNLDLSMFDLSGDGDFKKGLENIDELINLYKKWINELEKEKNNIDKKLTVTAERHITECKTYLKRMRDGLGLIKKDSKVRKAFQYMNLAVLTQQIRYSHKTREWNEKGELEDQPRINLKEKNTWPEDWLGNWYSFQIGFILACIKGVAYPDSGDRNIVDTLWFPTGGGKTEAYLGLTAFTIFLRRIKNPYDAGTVTLMRYTLRLLTTQQFQRAASLITACEQIRRDNDLGGEPISIGLWVGNAATPNRRKGSEKYPGAIEMLNHLHMKPSTKNPFVLLKCPWCASRMGPVKFDEGSYAIKGYKKTRLPNGSFSVVYQCDDKDCEFSSTENRLPVSVIDDDIYDYPCSLIIGTVDKFASLPYRSDAYRIFGIGKDFSPPELIIQDELHLISGPLGSMVGMYETLVSSLCTRDGYKPKIVASTATITRAKEQVMCLYDCDNEQVGLFPPSGLDENDNFFGKKSNESDESRKYIGVFPSAYSSAKTAQVRLVSSLLQAVKTIDVPQESDIDPYWTIMYYFNSLRELGGAATLIRDDIKSQIPKIQFRKFGNVYDKEKRRPDILRSLELTSRAPGDEIVKSLERLEYTYPDQDKGKRPVDICLATNMISVGLDIGRLGLMVVNGQPKSFSEYIQTTSRVGRKKGKPGLVYTLFNVSKPRDRSHYEQFRNSHQSLYSMVEPSSVTPFATPVREKALHAVLVGLCRSLYSEAREHPTGLPENVDEAVSIIVNRVKRIDPDEYDDTIARLNDILEHWRNYNPTIYGNMVGRVSDKDSWPLLYPSGKVIINRLKTWVFETPTSLRNVDSECRGMILQRDYSEFAE